MEGGFGAIAAAAAIVVVAASGGAQVPASGGTPPDELRQLRQQIVSERQRLDEQQRALEASRARLDSLERALVNRTSPPPSMTASTAQIVRQPAAGAATTPQRQAALTPGAVPLPSAPPASAGTPGSSAPAIQPVGEAPTEQRQVQVAVLAEQGGIITRQGRLTLQADLEYARADRNRVVFRGVEIPQSVLIGVFDINESRQDVLTAAVVGRLGLTSRLEINGRIPYVYRSDKSVLAPVADPNQPNAGQIDGGVSDGGIGDVDFGVRYQFTNGGNGSPYLIAGLQAIAPTGTNPFAVDRDVLGNALEAATGAGFWGLSPSLTAILPTDPGVLFGSLGYTRNFGRDIGEMIGSSYIERVRPGDERSASAGLAISLNPRTSLSLGYAHTWSTGTRTRLRVQDAQTGALGDAVSRKTRDLQLGRFLFGVSYRVSPRTTVNWNVELGATDDATDVRTSLRIPFVLDAF
jgi:hypothetical protein